MNVRYHVELTDTSARTWALLSKASSGAKLKRAQILLAADAGVTDEIAVTVGVSGSTCTDQATVRKGNLEHALSEESRPAPSASSPARRKPAVATAARTRRPAVRADAGAPCG